MGLPAGLLSLVLNMRRSRGSSGGTAAEDLRDCREGVQVGEGGTFFPEIVV